eukprot:scaffold162877_cov24-Tisochrysis_lutea.AAC.2
MKLQHISLLPSFQSACWCVYGNFLGMHACTEHAYTHMYVCTGSGSLRGGLRGLLHPQEKSTRSTDKSARSTDKSARGRTSLSGGLRSKLVLPTPEDLTYDTACSACFSPSLVADGISPFQANDSCIESQTTGRSAVAC